MEKIEKKVTSHSEMHTENKELGFEDNLSVPGIRLMNKDGSLNVDYIGGNRFSNWSLYKYLIKMPAIKFFGGVLLAYVFLNILFASIYYFIGVDGLSTSKNYLNWLDCFWFSTQTFTTVGYGHISPVSFLVNLLASFEAFIGLIFFAVATGLVYGRFSTSKADIKFSQNILIDKRGDNQFLSVRLANLANTELSELDAILIISYIKKEGNNLVRIYNTLPLELKSISLLTTSWTILHKITEDSPCQILNSTSQIQGLEFLLFISAFDEVFDQKIKVRTSYLHEDLIISARFTPITSYSSTKTIVDIDKLSSYKKL